MKTKRQFFAGPPLEKLAPSGLREAEKANIPFVAARFATLTGALRRCSSLVWLATRRSERLALHPASAPKNGILTISASLKKAQIDSSPPMIACSQAVCAGCRSGRYPLATGRDGSLHHSLQLPA